MNPSETSSPLFAADDKLVAIWDRMQRLQSDFCYPSELPFYCGSERWRKARRVLDAGTGNGYYLGIIDKYFPDKLYTGVDNNAALIERAKHENTRPNISFRLAPYDQMEGELDAIIMRLFLQHVPDISGVLKKARSLLAPGGSIIVIDALDGGRLYAPALPEFTNFFDAYAAESARRELGRNVLNRVEEAIASIGQCRVDRCRQVYISSASGNNMELFRETYALFIDLVELSGFLDYDFDRVRTAWRAWCALETAYTQVAVNMIELALDG